MMEHNHSHAGELAAVAEKLSEMGEGPAAERLKAGVKDFEAGNEKLAQALSLIKKDNA
jgi:cobalamin biosynthesis protein CbiG